MMHVTKIRFRAGQKVRFIPKFARYATTELAYKNQVGIIIDESDLPNVKMGASYWGGRILTADQRDLVLA